MARKKATEKKEAKPKNPEPKITSAEASQVIVKELEVRRMACMGERDAVLKKYGFEQQATMTIGRGFIEPRIVLVPVR